MDLTVIIYIVAAFIIGIVVTFIFKQKDNNSVDKSQLTTLSKENESLKMDLSNLSTEKESLKTKLSDAEKKLEQIEAESSDKVEEVKKKFETLLNEAYSQSAKLDNQLKNALAGNIDDSITEQLAEVEKLKKTIKNLEDDLEEANEDLSDVQKKLKSKDADIADLQDNYAKEQKKSSELNSELSTVKANLKEKIEELNLKMESLDFIQEVLSAKEISTADINKLNKNIDFFESFVKGQFTDLNAYLFSTYKLAWNNIEGIAGFEKKKTYYHDAFDQWSSTKRKSWLDGKTTIAFVGEFSAGKTSIVNRILSQDNVNIPQLPVSTKATTAIPTYIAGGSTVSYSFISGDGKRKTILENTFKKVSKDILDQVKGVSSLIKYFVMTYKNPNLNGLSILDTPGFNSNDSEDRERTIEVINECDALFWVFDVNAGTVNRSSISIIKEKLNKPLYVVINKVDTKSDSEVQKVEKLIKKTLSDEGLQVQQFIKFSSKAPLASIMNPIKGVNKITTRDTFVSDVRTDLEQLLSFLDDAVKKWNQSYNTACQEGDKITDQFIECIKNLQDDCDTAYNIPQFSEGFKVLGIGTDDKFVMTPYEGEHLKELLSNIAFDKVQALAQIFDERVDKAAEIQQEWSDLCDLKAAWQKVNDCFEQYKKVSKNIE